MIEIIYNHNGKNEIIQANQGQTIFESLDSAGLNLPHGCLAGSCGSCVVEITHHPNNLQPMGFIETNTIESLSKFYPNKIIRLACRAKINGPVQFTTLR